MEREVMADLKPMELGEILDGALKIFGRNFALFVKIGVAALWLPVALTIYVQLAGGRQEHLVLVFVIAFIQYFAGLFLTASAIRVISDSYLGREPQLGDALSLGASKIWSLFVVGLGKAIILGLIFILLVAVGAGAAAAMGSASGLAVLLFLILFVGGCWFVAFVACGYAVTTPVVVLENLGGSFDAFGRSWELTRGFKRKIFAIGFVTWVIVFVPSAALGTLGAYFMLEAPIVGQIVDVASAALPIVMTPITSCVVTLLYYDLRVRREAFDLQILSQQLGIT
jgi:hypothetical protein